MDYLWWERNSTVFTISYVTIHVVASEIYVQFSLILILTLRPSVYQGSTSGNFPNESVLNDNMTRKIDY
jgi:hypothetical protein